jgi:hypothetical protein
MVYGLFLVIYEVYLQIWFRYLTIGIRAKVIKARACASTHLCTSRAPDMKPIKRCMEDYQHYGKSSSYRNNPRATVT